MGEERRNKRQCIKAILEAVPHCDSKKAIERHAEMSYTSLIKHYDNLVSMGAIDSEITRGVAPSKIELTPFGEVMLESISRDPDYGNWKDAMCWWLTSNTQQKIGDGFLNLLVLVENNPKIRPNLSPMVDKFGNNLEYMLWNNVTGLKVLPEPSESKMVMVSVDAEVATMIDDITTKTGMSIADLTMYAITKIYTEV